MSEIPTGVCQHCGIAITAKHDCAGERVINFKKAQEVARELSGELIGHDWLSGVGVRINENGKCIILVLINAEPDDRSVIPESFNGYDVNIKVVGHIVAA